MIYNEKKGDLMATAKVIEVICDGPSIEAAMHAGVKEACKTLKNVKQIDVIWIHGHVEDGKITHFRVNAKISFVLEH